MKKLRRFLVQVSFATLFIALVTSCAETSGSDSRSNRLDTVKSKSKGVVSLIPINSDNVLRAGYNENNFVMTVQFENGYTYEYFDVTEALWIRFLDAQPNPWSEVGYPELVKGGYRYRKIN